MTAIGKRRADKDAAAAKADRTTAGGFVDLERQDLDERSGGAATGLSAGDCAQKVRLDSGETASRIKYGDITLNKG